MSNEPNDRARQVLKYNKTTAKGISRVVAELQTLVAAFPPGVSTEAKQDTQITQFTTISSTLTSILNNLAANQDLEILLVRDTGDSDKIVKEIKEYDQGTGTTTTSYENAAGGVHTVIGPLEYLDASAVLNLILTELQGGIDVDITGNTVGLATQTTLVALLTELQAKADLTETQPVSLASSPLPTGAATETTLASILAKIIAAPSTEAKQDAVITALGLLLTETQFDSVLGEVQLTPTNFTLLGRLKDIADTLTNMYDSTPLSDLLTELQLKADLSETQPVSLATTARTPTLVRRTDATGSPIAAGARSISFYNAGTASGTVLGTTLKKGESVAINAGGEEDTLGAVSYDGTGTELVILIIT